MSTKLNYNIDWSEHFYLDSESPSGLRWNRDVRVGRARRLRIEKGSYVGCLVKESGKIKAWMVNLNKKSYCVHRIIWFMVHGYSDTTKVIDHLNGDPSDNRIQNLSLKTIQENSQNRFKSKNNKTGVNGVSLYKSGYGAESCVAGCKVNLKDKKKYFSFKKYGKDEAFRLACEFRVNMVTSLNEDGANYTERHGK